MQKKIEDIEHIQYSLWGMYKDFLADKDLDRYKSRTDAFLNGYKESRKYFCRNLIIEWTAVVDGLAEDFKHGRNVEEKTNCIKHIQNTLWAMYKDFLEDHDMGVYNNKAQKLTREYARKGDKQLLSFCQNMILSWSPIINESAEEFRKGEG